MSKLKEIIGKKYKGLDENTTIVVLDKEGVRNVNFTTFASEFDEYPQPIVVYKTENSNHILYLSEDTILSNIENGIWTLIS